MANLKSTKKRAKQSLVRRKKNLNRMSAIKTAIKKVHESLQKGDSFENTRVLLQDVEAKLARAKSKHLMHAKTAERTLSRLAHRVQKTAA